MKTALCHCVCLWKVLANVVKVLNCSHTISLFTFYHHQTDTTVDYQFMCVLHIAKAQLSDYTEASFFSLSDIHESLGGL